MQAPCRPAGFSLIELMIAVAVIGILAAIALPVYTESVRKGRRSDAQAALTGLAAAMERDFIRANRYNNPFTAGIYPNRVPLDGGTITYNLSATVSDTAYTLTAAPAGPQAGDRCGSLTLASNGAQGASATDCWRR